MSAVMIGKCVNVSTPWMAMRGRYWRYTNAADPSIRELVLDEAERASRLQV